MERIIVKIIKRGNSLGFIVPKKVVRKLGIKPGDYVEVSFPKKKQSRVQGNPLRELFGSLKGKEKDKRPLSEFMKEIDRELYKD